jgi:hypothetical protein
LRENVAPRLRRTLGTAENPGSPPRVPDNPFVNNEFLCAFSELADRSKMSMEQAQPMAAMNSVAAERARADFPDAAMTVRCRRAKSLARG